MKVAIKAIEYYLPTCVENGKSLKADNPDWRIGDIEEKTGIKNRYIAEENETAVDMAEHAARKLLSSEIKPDDVDFVILVTQSPDYALPTSACILQDRLKLKTSCLAFDVNLGCSGFVYGLAIASSLISAGLVKSGLLVCSDTYTKFIDKHDRTCRPLFSDGAAATLLTSSADDLIGPFELGSDGSGFDKLIVKSSGAHEMQNQTQEKKLYMEGSSVFMFTMDMVPKCVNGLLKKANKEIDDIDLFVFHQASKLVIDSIIRRLDLPENKVFTNYQNVGNTVSATIPIALCDILRDKGLKSGSQVMLVGFGVGYSWGGCIVQWGPEA